MIALSSVFSLTALILLTESTRQKTIENTGFIMVRLDCYYCDNYFACSKNEFLKYVKKMHLYRMDCPQLWEQ